MNRRKDDDRFWSRHRTGKVSNEAVKKPKQAGQKERIEPKTGNCWRWWP
jgi:hypothetical protein